MTGRRMIIKVPVDTELLALKKRVTALEEQVRTLTAANLALVRTMEHLQRTGDRMSPS